MTGAHLLFAVATTAYILIAIQFEEKDLVRIHGSQYENSVQQAPVSVVIRYRATIWHCLSPAVPVHGLLAVG